MPAYYIGIPKGVICRLFFLPLYYRPRSRSRPARSTTTTGTGLCCTCRSSASRRGRRSCSSRRPGSSTWESGEWLTICSYWVTPPPKDTAQETCAAWKFCGGVRYVSKFILLIFSSNLIYIKRCRCVNADLFFQAAGLTLRQQL